MQELAQSSATNIVVLDSDELNEVNGGIFFVARWLARYIVGGEAADYLAASDKDSIEQQNQSLGK